MHRVVLFDLLAKHLRNLKSSGAFMRIVYFVAYAPHYNRRVITVTFYPRFNILLIPVGEETVVIVLVPVSYTHLDVYKRQELSLAVSLFVLSLLSAAELSAALLSFLLSVAELVFCDEQAQADVRIDAQASIAAVNLILSFIVCPFFMRGKYIAEYIIPTYSL